MGRALTKPRRLAPGDAIGLVTPASPAPRSFPDRYAHAKAELARAGFRVVEGACAAESQGYRSAPPRARADELNAMLGDPRVRAVMATTGGMNASSLLPFVDFDLLARDPKPVVGFSDVTALLLPLAARASVITFYGPTLVPSFGEWPHVLPFTLDAFRAVVCDGWHGVLATPAAWTNERLDWSDGTWKTRARSTQPGAPVTLVAGRATGPLWGGNLDTLPTLLGTPLMPDLGGAILVIEDGEHPLTRIERSLATLDAHGVFDAIAGLVVGRPERAERGGAPFGLHELVLEALRGRRVPVLADASFGHTAPIWTLPLGVRATLDADRGMLSLDEPAVT